MTEPRGAVRNLLVIKQTSLGDVLHISGHLRALKTHFPDSHLTLLTAAGSADIYRHSPWVDEILILDRARLRRLWRHPLAGGRYLGALITQVRRRRYDLAFDLQGLARSVLFLYAARAREKYVKGHWWGLRQYRAPRIHAIAELDGVLRRAGVPPRDTSMEFPTSQAAQRHVDRLLAGAHPRGAPLLVFSPFSRWPSKDWPLARYFELAAGLGADYAIAFTGTPADRDRIEQGLVAMAPAPTRPLNLAGRLDVVQFAALVGRAALLVGSDSFPMHVAGACATPVVALFGPTDERRVGPVGRARIVRAASCLTCDRRGCRRGCMADISVAIVNDAARALLRR